MTDRDDACPRCEGCGQIADTEQAGPWTWWLDLKPPSNMAVVIGLVKPIPCPKCGGTGSRTEGAR